MEERGSLQASRFFPLVMWLVSTTIVVSLLSLFLSKNYCRANIIGTNRFAFVEGFLSLVLSSNIF